MTLEYRLCPINVNWCPSSIPESPNHPPLLPALRLFPDDIQPLGWSLRPEAGLRGPKTFPSQLGCRQSPRESPPGCLRPTWGLCPRGARFPGPTAQQCVSLPQGAHHITHAFQLLRLCTPAPPLGRGASSSPPQAQAQAVSPSLQFLVLSKAVLETQDPAVPGHGGWSLMCLGHKTRQDL